MLETLLDFGLFVVVGQDVAPDLNQFGQTQLEATRHSAVLDSTDSAMSQLVLLLLDTVHTMEGDSDLPEREGCQPACG